MGEMIVERNFSVMDFITPPFSFIVADKKEF